LLCLSGVLLALALLSVHTIRTVKELYKLSGQEIWDPHLPSVHNRAYLEQRLDLEVYRSHRYGSPLTVVALDISGYYRFTAEYGHHAGKVAVEGLAQRLVASLRETDIVARLRDDTLVLVLPDTPESTVGALERRLRAELDKIPVLNTAKPESAPVTINVNFGFSHCLLSTVDGSELLGAAVDNLRGRSLLGPETRSYPAKTKSVVKSTPSTALFDQTLDAA